MRRFLAVAIPLAVLCAIVAAVASAWPASTVTTSATQSSFLLSSQSNACANYGGYDVFQVGTNAVSVKRGLVEFDLSSIPANAQIISATLSLYETITLRGSGTVGVHLVTTPWAPGSGAGGCRGNGANWTVTGLGNDWTSAGGDFVAQDAASVVKTAGEAPGWDSFDVTQLVQGWVGGRVPNDGLLIKLDDESFSPCTTLTNCNYWSYASANATDPSLRPTLTVEYSD